MQPQKIVFGTGCIQTLVEDYKKMGYQRLFVLTAPPILPLIEEPLAELKAAGISIETYQDIVAEPTVDSRGGTQFQGRQRHRYRRRFGVGRHETRGSIHQ